MNTVLIAHIVLCSLGYLLFAAAFVLACVYMYRDRAIKTKQFRLGSSFSLSLNHLDRLLFLTLTAGFVLTGIGLPLGLAVQKTVHGTVDLTSLRFTLPAAIWLFYLFMLLFRLLTGLRGRIPAQLSVFGFNFAAFSLIFELYLAAQTVH